MWGWATVPLMAIALGSGFAIGVVFGIARSPDEASFPRQPIASRIYQQVRELPVLQRALASRTGDRDPRVRELAELERELSRLDERLTRLESALDLKPTASSENRTRLAAIAARLEELGTASVETIALPSDLLFTRDIVLDPTQRSLFDASIGQIEQFPGAEIYIASHTDPAGDSGGERAFSFDRAAQVARYLQERVDRKRGNYRWIAIGYGSTRPLADGTSEIDRQRNRRIELEIRPTAGAAP